MAMKRKAPRAGRRPRKYARKMARKAPLRMIANQQVYPFRRFFYKYTTGGTDAVQQFAAINFTLSDVPSATDFTSLFDQYKIAGIKYRWCLNRNPDYAGAVVSNVYNTAVQGTFPRVFWVHDYDSSNAPASFAELQQYPKAQEVYLTPGRPHTQWFYFKPARLAVEYESATLSAYRPTWKGFIDCASADTPHYGIRMSCDGLNSNVQLRLECWYYLVFKNVR